MNTVLRFFRSGAMSLGLLALAGASLAQTDGSVSLTATIIDYPGNGDDHWAVGWVTTSSGAFIKTLWKQGPSSFTNNHWSDHCNVWWNAKQNTSNGGNNTLDGYTSATAKDYSTTITSLPRPNNPIAISWDCRDKDGVLMPDGDYKFWIQYSEEDESKVGPYTTNGLPWTKGPAASSPAYPNQGANFVNMSVAWTPDLPPVLGFAVARSGSDLLLNGSGPANGSYTLLSSVDLSQPVELWTEERSGSFNGAGQFSITVPIGPGVLERFYRFRVP